MNPTPYRARPPRRPKILVLFNRVPEASARRPAEEAAAVAASLLEAGFHVATIDVEDDTDRVLWAVMVEHPDVIYNLVDHFEEDPVNHAAVAGYYWLLGVPYTGSEPFCLTSCAERARTYLMLADAGVPVPRFAVIRDVNTIPDTEGFRPPLVVSSPFEDVYRDGPHERFSSDRDELAEHVAAMARESALPLLVEELVASRRLHVAVLGNRTLDVLPITETLEEVAGVALAQLDQETADQVRLLARRAFRVMGCRDVAQVDVHLDGQGAPHVVDVRPVVSVWEGSPLRVAADNSGRGFDGVVAEIATLACRRAHLMEEEEEQAAAEGEGETEGETEGEAEGETEGETEAEAEAGDEGEAGAGGEAAARGAGDAHR